CGFRAAWTTVAVIVCIGIHSTGGRAQGAGEAGSGGAGDASIFEAYVNAFAQLNGHEIAALALTLRILCFAVATDIMLVRTRARLVETEAAARDDAVALKAEVDRVYALLRTEPQILVAWAAADDQPEIVGDTALVANADAPHRVLAFGTWLEPDQAQAMAGAVDALRARGEGLSAPLTTLAGRPLEAEGQVVGGRAILRLKDVGGIKREFAELRMRLQQQVEECEAVRTLVETLPSPVWARDEAGKLVFVNSAYARAVEVKDPTEAVGRGIELFDRAAREELFRAHEAAKPYAGRLPAIVTGSRYVFDVQTFPARGGSAGIAIDATAAETMRADMKRLVEAHRRTLDQLATGVAIFGSDQRLTFYNAAYRALWDLDASFLDQRPTDSAVLEQLRSAHKLPEEHNFRQWN